jgi:uncharacterized membrane protein
LLPIKPGGSELTEQEVPEPSPSPQSSAPPQEGKTPRPRIQTLSDLIFGLALSIGAITLITTKPTDLISMTYYIALFGFSFLILALIWIRYTRIMSVFPVEGGILLGLNFLLLFLASIEPYLFNLIVFPPVKTLEGTFSAAYAVDLGSMNLVLAYFTHEIAKEEANLIRKDLLWSYRLSRNTSLASAALFLFSVLPIFSIYERFVFWFASFGILVIRNFLERRHKRKPNALS